jgi:hypothetical protein
VLLAITSNVLANQEDTYGYLNNSKPSDATNQINSGFN